MIKPTTISGNLLSISIKNLNLEFMMSGNRPNSNKNIHSIVTKTSIINAESTPDSEKYCHLTGVPNIEIKL